MKGHRRHKAAQKGMNLTNGDQPAVLFDPVQPSLIKYSYSIPLRLTSNIGHLTINFAPHSARLCKTLSATTGSCRQTRGCGLAPMLTDETLTEYIGALGRS